MNNTKYEGIKFFGSAALVILLIFSIVSIRFVLPPKADEPTTSNIKNIIAYSNLPVWDYEDVVTKTLGFPDFKVQVYDGEFIYTKLHMPFTWKPEYYISSFENGKEYIYYHSENGWGERVTDLGKQMVASSVKNAYPSVKWNKDLLINNFMFAIGIFGFVAIGILVYLLYTSDEKYHKSVDRSLY